MVVLKVETDEEIKKRVGEEMVKQNKIEMFATLKNLFGNPKKATYGNTDIKPLYAECNRGMSKAIRKEDLAMAFGRRNGYINNDDIDNLTPESDADYWRNLTESEWVESMNLTMNNYFLPLKAQIMKGTYNNNVVYQFDENTYKLTVDPVPMQRCLRAWQHMSYARDEILLSLSKMNGFNFLTYLSSLSNEASRARDKILYKIILKEEPKYAPVFGTYEAFIIGHPFEGNSVQNAVGAKYDSLQALEDHLRSQGYTII